VAAPYFTDYFKTVMSHALKIGCAPRELAQFTQMELENINQLVGNLFKGIQTGFLILIGSLIMVLYLSILQPVFEMVNIL
jgi:type II secretory pathway component PulF